jgi:hypothetical protein
MAYISSQDPAYTCDSMSYILSPDPAYACDSMTYVLRRPYGARIGNGRPES